MKGTPRVVGCGFGLKDVESIEELVIQEALLECETDEAKRLVLCAHLLLVPEYSSVPYSQGQSCAEPEAMVDECTTDEVLMPASISLLISNMRDAGKRQLLLLYGARTVQLMGVDDFQARVQVTLIGATFCFDPDLVYKGTIVEEGDKSFHWADPVEEHTVLLDGNFFMDRTIQKVAETIHEQEDPRDYIPSPPSSPIAAPVQVRAPAEICSRRYLPFDGEELGHVLLDARPFVKHFEWHAKCIILGRGKRPPLPTTPLQYAELQWCMRLLCVAVSRFPSCTDVFLQFQRESVFEFFNNIGIAMGDKLDVLRDHGAYYDLYIKGCKGKDVRGCGDHFLPVVEGVVQEYILRIQRYRRNLCVDDDGKCGALANIKVHRIFLHAMECVEQLGRDAGYIQ